ncbi:hypothetical protein MRQ36_01950 [Micromonospora sp. R77]|uniref:hypothetical protein n=1 Tax=Micromonospora sp. R77 TaxID=2925836 RepID=UPI001F6133BE|nr:hypothetical protein [Micromonospora sp. R77]MCI4061404.1 hypothetical protein [Micromonospora sp. R77]
MDIENVGEAMGETDAVPVDLDQTWGKGRNVDGDVKGEDSSLVFTRPEPDGKGGFVDADGNPVDEDGKYIPQSDGKGGWVDGDGTPVTKEGAPLPPADGSIPGAVTPGFTVSTGSIRDAETTILGLTKTEIDAFETFRDSVMQRASWIFYAEAYEQTVVQKQGGGPPTNGNTYGTFQWDEVEYYPNVVDPHPEMTEQLQYSQYQLLQSVGGALELVGQYVAKLNNSAQMYASADIQSAPPTD